MENDLETPDEVLVVAAMLGDFEAFGTLVRRYRAGVVRAAQAVVGPDHCEDVAQEALLIAFKALPTLEEPDKFPAWLSVITRHLALRFEKREQKRSSTQVVLDELLIERMPALALPPGERIKEEELESALADMSPDYALAVRLHCLDGMPLKHVAAFLGISLATAKWRVHRGKALLRERMKLSDRNEMPWKKTRR